MRLLLATAAVLSLLTSAAAHAEDGGDGRVTSDGGPPLPGGFDGSFPDGSVGEGGADRDQQEGDDATGRVPASCRRSIECPQSFQCIDARCRYTGVRKADGGFGCGGMAAGTALPIGVFVSWMTRRRRRAFVLFSPRQ